jgi:hypothetical protein
MAEKVMDCVNVQGLRRSSNVVRVQMYFNSKEASRAVLEYLVKEYLMGANLQ